MSKRTAVVVRRLLVLFVLFLSAAVAASSAGELCLSWDSSDNATGYRVYRYTVTGQPPEKGADNAAGDAPEAPFCFQDWPNDCSAFYLAVTAYNNAGESEHSDEVGTVGRPEITDVTQNENGVHTIHGTNFAPNAKVYVNATGTWVEVPSGDVTWVSCGELRIPALPMYSVRVGNPAVPTGTGEPSHVLSLPWPGPANPNVY